MQRLDTRAHGQHHASARRRGGNSPLHRGAHHPSRDGYKERCGVLDAAARRPTARQWATEPLAQADQLEGKGIHPRSDEGVLGPALLEADDHIVEGPLIQPRLE